MRSLALLACTLWLVVSATTAPGYAQEKSNPPTNRDITAPEISVAMDLLMRAGAHQAMSYLDSLQAVCDRQPLFLITRGRVLIEFIPIDDHKKDFTKEMSKAALSVFDRAIDICSQRMDEGDPDLRLQLYRGWSWMQKSHIRALGRSFYTAGRDAGRGKKDLEKYLGAHPDDPSANGLLGAFLYFTDAIPSIFKFLSKLLFLPTGDRDRGLDLMQRAVREHNPFEVDYVQLLNNVYVFFEGRYEEGLQGATELVDRYPAYPRPVIALAVASLFAPSGHAKYIDRVQRVISELEARDPRQVDLGSLNILRVARAYTERFLGNPDHAMDRFESIVGDSPQRPDWVESFGQFQLGQLYADAGRIDEAGQMLRLTIDNNKSDLFRDPAKKVLEDLESFTDLLERPAKGPDGRWIKNIYTAGKDSLTAVAARCETLAPTSLPAAFYVAECRLLLGELDAAIDAYDDIIEREAPAWQHTYQMIACTRVAEIVALSADYERAAEYQKRALDFYQNEYRVDWMIEGRQQYFERLGNGDGHAPAPTLLFVPE
ncbi:MAG: tetratricopeptide repeat protein [Candidatus Krumholzibacteria bacterium]|nr:tetratricopeptide repeat protein [Candidatus Krumholzibacteria bacterium]